MNSLNTSYRAFVGQVILVVSMCIFILFYSSQSFRPDTSFRTEITEIYKYVNVQRQEKSESVNVLFNASQSLHVDKFFQNRITKVNKNVSEHRQGTPESENILHHRISTAGKLSGARKLELCDGDSAYLESTELRQMYKFWKNPRKPGQTRRVDNDDIRNTHKLLGNETMKELAKFANVSRTELASLNWTIQASLEIRDSCSILHLNLTEKIHNRISQGGSSFELTVENNINRLKAMCSVVDMFNGTYEFRCPCLSKEVLNGSIGFLRFSFANFEAYWRKWKPWNHTIWTDYLGNLRIYQGQTDDTGYCLGYWQRINNILTWVQSGSPITRLGKSEILTCFERYQRITFVGDSHIRYTFFYWLNIRGIIDTKLPKPKYFKDGNTEYYREDYINETYTRLLKFESEIKNTAANPKRLLIVNSLHWEIFKYRDKFYSYFNRAEQVVDVLRRLSSVDNLTVVWFTAPPFPEQYAQAPYLRNNFILRATNTWAQIHMHKAGIQIFDVFNIIYSKHEENVCGGHYLCNHDDRWKNMKTFGNVGISVAETFLNKLCST